MIHGELLRGAGTWWELAWFLAKTFAIAAEPLTAEPLSARFYAKQVLNKC